MDGRGAAAERAVRRGARWSPGARRTAPAGRGVVATVAGGRRRSRAGRAAGRRRRHDAFETVRTNHPLHAVLPVLRQTLTTIADEASHIMIVTDAQGMILWREGAADVRRQADRIALSEGAVWSEDTIGTNGMGTALAADQPVQIHSAEHLVRRIHEWTCAAAPVHDPDTGKLIGAVDVSGPLRTVHPGDDGAGDRRGQARRGATAGPDGRGRRDAARPQHAAPDRARRLTRRTAHADRPRARRTTVGVAARPVRSCRPIPTASSSATVAKA